MIGDYEHGPWCTILNGVGDVQLAYLNWHMAVYVRPLEAHTGVYALVHGPILHAAASVFKVENAAIRAKAAAVVIEKSFIVLRELGRRA